MKKSLFIILFGIVLISSFFRLYNLQSVPPQPTVDEVSIGWNAYSILKTGADEYGTKFPVLLRAYDDFRPAIYTYLVIPFVAILGLDVLAVRLPSAILGVLAVLGTYFLVKELVPNAKKFSISNFQFSISEIAALLLAISPWHIYISRLGHEVNAAFTFLILGMLFFFRFMNGQKWSFYLSALFFGLSFDSYQTTKIVIPLILLALLGLYLKKLIKEKTTVFISVLIGLAIIFPIIISSFDENALIRFKGTSLLENSQTYFESVGKRFVKDKKEEDLLGIVFDNRKVASVLLVSNAYFSHFDPVWLFLNKGEEPFKAPTVGLLYLFELPLIFVSLLFLTKSQMSSKNIIFILAWGGLAVTAASLTTGFPHAMRAINILPVPQILGAFGFIAFLGLIRNLPAGRQGKKIQLAFVIFFAGFVTISVLWFFHAYFSLLPKELGNHFQYGVINALRYTDLTNEKYDKVVISNKDRLFESYMFYLYLKKYDPLLYQEMGGTVSGGFAQEPKIDKYIFGKIDDKISKNTLYVLNPSEVKREMNVLTEIKYLDGTTSLVIAEIK